MRQEDGYCDVCGCEVDTPQLTINGHAVCASCVKTQTPATILTAKRPEARDDGR